MSVPEEQGLLDAADVDMTAFASFVPTEVEPTINPADVRDDDKGADE